MRRSVALLILGIAAACRSQPSPAPLAPQTGGTMAIAGLNRPVRVVFDQWGIPHIYAQDVEDLFIAQGFVQAQDRLFQMDLWRRASQGRLAEILGANFVERDTMTRRIQYRGDGALEWASYGAEAHTISEAFVRGINAYVSLARERLPLEFQAAGWPPSYWFADDLLNRTEAFRASSGALEAIRRAGYPDVVADAIRSIGTPPFLVGARPPESEIRARDGTPLTAPSPRYLVHLIAPGWNVIGATAPWRPGVVEGHTASVAWTISPRSVSTQDINVERLNRTIVTDVPDFLRVKGRPRGIMFTRETTPDGAVVATDRERKLVYTVRWLGFEPGGAAELGALALDNARSVAEFRNALSHWKLPGRRFSFFDVDGGSGMADVPSNAMFGPANRHGALEGADPDPPDTQSGASVDRPATFAHVLGVGNRQLFNVGPVARPADDRQTRMVTEGREWDLWRTINAPGQSGSPGSRHYADAAALWSGGGTFELSFSEDAVRAHAEGTLILIPRR